jgi:hypothetical protein
MDETFEDNFYTSTNNYSHSSKQKKTNQRRNKTPSNSNQNRCNNDMNDLSKLERTIDPEVILPSESNSSFEEKCYSGCHMIQKWRNDFFPKRCQLKGNEEYVADAARSGLLDVGLQECVTQNVLKRTNREFNLVKVKSRNKILMYCIRLYTRNVFVYRVVNEALRNNDETQSETLGPFCYLLTVYLYDNNTPTYNGNVYRSCYFEQSIIDQYRQIMNEQQRVKWLGFTSTSKSIKVAKGFGGNVIFNIDLTQFTQSFSFNRPVDISHLSEMKDEEEVLLPAGFKFIVTEIKDNVNDDDDIIFIDIIGLKL